MSKKRSRLDVDPMAVHVRYLIAEHVRHMRILALGMSGKMASINDKTSVIVRNADSVLALLGFKVEQVGQSKVDSDDIGQGEGCEGGKCEIKYKVCLECGTARTCRACKVHPPVMR